MFVIDAHQDIALNALSLLRDYRQSALAHRRREAGTPMPPATIGLPDALLGRVGIVFATLFVAPKTPDTNWPVPGRSPVYSTPEEAHAEAMAQLDYYNKLADEDARVRIIRTAADLNDVVASWDDNTDISNHLHGLVILMEGADPIIEPPQFEEWYERGVRLVGPAWRATRYSGGTGQPGSLTRLGRDLLDVMMSHNALLDVSHMAEKAFNEALEHYEGQIIASHSNPRSFNDSDRHLSDDMIRRLAERDGVMGVVLFNKFLSDDWYKGAPRGTVTLETPLNAIDHICQVTGSAAHVGIGSDFDGGFGADQIPDELDTTTDLWRFKDGLEQRGYSADDIAAILSGNMLRKLRAVLPQG